MKEQIGINVEQENPKEKIEKDDTSQKEKNIGGKKLFLKKGTETGFEDVLEQGWQKRGEETRKDTNKLIDNLLEYGKQNTWSKETKNKQEPLDENRAETTKANQEKKEENPSEINPDAKRIAAFVETKNKDFFGQMSDMGKEIMSNAYEGIYMTPGLNRLVGKMEIAHNQFWINKKEGKASRLKNRMDAFGLKNKSLNTGISEINNAAKILEEFGMGGSASLLVKSKKLEDSISGNENKIDKLQGRVEKRENRVKLFTNKRDAIADRLITHYEKKLSPIEGKLEVLEEKRNEVELFCIASEVRLDEQRAKITKIEEAKKKIQKSYMDAGFSDRQIRKNDVIKELESQINNSYSFIQIEQAKIATEREEINKKIVKTNKKAEPYRNRKNQFVRVKDNRPIDFKLEERKYADEFKGTESTESHPRDSGEYVYGTENREEPSRSYFESSFENMDRFTNLIEKYNKLVKEKGHEIIKIDEKELSQATRLSSSNQMSTKNFKRIIEQYYKAKKIKEKEYKDIINNFK